MKNSFILTFLFSIMILSFACGQKEGSESNGGGSFSANINGIAWSSTFNYDTSSKFWKNFSGLNEKSGIGIALLFDVADAVAGKTIPINTKGKKGTVGYKLWATDGSMNLIDNEEGTIGSITITKATPKQIEGTFESKGTKKTITGGKFLINLEKFF
jgi:hypothetical protein